MNPYIGITGFMDPTEVSKVLASVPPGTKRRLMVGVLANGQTLRGIKNRQPNRYPRRERLGWIFQDDPRALNLVHFNTSDPGSLHDRLVEVLELAGPHCHGLQLNLAWPDPAVLERLARDARRKPTIVLQVGTRALERVGRSPEALAQKIAEEYRTLVHYVLLDASGGRGRSLDPDGLGAKLRALAAKQLPIGFGVAGGLSASTLPFLAPLAQEFPELSVDAEGRLRNEGDQLDLEAAVAYLERALALFEVDPPPPTPEIESAEPGRAPGQFPLGAV